MTTVGRRLRTYNGRRGDEIVLVGAGDMLLDIANEVPNFRAALGILKTKRIIGTIGLSPDNESFW